MNSSFVNSYSYSKADGDFQGRSKTERREKKHTKLEAISVTLMT